MSYATAREIAVSEIPVIDAAPLADGGEAGVRDVAAAMRAAAERIGFFYIGNHGVPDAVLTAADAAARAFFAQPLEDKLRARINDHHRGFLRVGEAKMYATANADLKESFVWGLDIDDAADGNRLIGANRWPADMPALRAALVPLFAAGQACGERLLRAFAASLDVPLDTFTRRIDKPVTRASIVYYPPQAPDAGADQFGVAPHTDYGCLTLVHQDAVGGLQVRGRDGEWVTAHPIPGTLVVNVGDLLARWTNDRFVSTPHRVVNSAGVVRHSMAVFVDPNFEAEIVPVCAAGEAPHYEPTTCGDYILSRLDASFAYRKEG